MGVLRILQVCQRPQRRGAEIFASQLNAELKRRGHEVAAAYLYPHCGEGALPLSEADHVLGGYEDHPLETAIGFRPSLLKKLTDVMRSFRPDITQVNGARTVKYSVLSRWLDGSAAGSIVYRNIGTPDDWIRGIRRKVFYHVILRNLDGVIPISRNSLEALQAVFPDELPVRVISNAVDQDALRPEVARAELRNSSGTPLSAPVTVFVGSLTQEKRVDRLIDSVGRVRASKPNLHLWIVGEGPLRPELECRVQRLGIQDYVRFFGARDDVGSLLAASDLLALPSDTEGVPAVVLEAGYFGLPVVATRVGGVPEVVLDGETGLIVDKDDPDLLDAALKRLSDDQALRTRLGSRARERVLARHSINRIADEFLDFYESVIGSDKRELRRSRMRSVDA